MKKIKFVRQTTKSARHFTKWIKPVMRNYYLACCDCGLVHTFNFRAVKIIKTYKDGKTYKYEPLSTKNYHVEYKVARNNKLTREQRKKK